MRLLHLWAFPLSFVGLLAAFLCRADYLRPEGEVLLFVAKERGLCAWFFKCSKFDAFTWGEVIVFRVPTFSARLLKHELRHAEQARWFGPLMPVVYGLCSLWALLKGGHAYRDNALEVDARRAEWR